jgi:potassium inwardly-rectifying channel subfamily J
VHRIDKFSALSGLSYEGMLDKEVEILAVLDAIDELTSASFQVRWSYLPSDMRWGHVFEEIVDRDSRGRISIDGRNLSTTTLIDDDPCADSSKPL